MLSSVSEDVSYLFLSPFGPGVDALVVLGHELKPSSVSSWQ